MQAKQKQRGSHGRRGDRVILKSTNNSGMSKYKNLTSMPASRKGQKKDMKRKEVLEEFVKPRSCRDRVYSPGMLSQITAQASALMQSVSLISNCTHLLHKPITDINVCATYSSHRRDISTGSGLNDFMCTKILNLTQNEALMHPE